MISNQRVLAVVPARSGSKGIPHKNMQLLAGATLIARAGMTLQSLPWIDRKIISTDDQGYADEAIRHGLEAPFLRPASLAEDQSGVVESLQHAVDFCESQDGVHYDAILIIEPTSPLRTPQDIVDCMRLLVDTGADSAVTVSRIDRKYHPRKLLTATDGRIRFFDPMGHLVKGRQELDDAFVMKNGACYALTRCCLMEKCRIISDNTVPLIIDRTLVNLDTPLELAFLDHLLASGGVADPLSSLPHGRE